MIISEQNPGVTRHPGPSQPPSRAGETISAHFYTVFESHQLESSGLEQPGVILNLRKHTHTIHGLHTENNLETYIKYIKVFICLL